MQNFSLIKLFAALRDVKSFFLFLFEGMLPHNFLSFLFLRHNYRSTMNYSIYMHTKTSTLEGITGYVDMRL